MDHTSDDAPYGRSHTRMVHGCGAVLRQRAEPHPPVSFFRTSDASAVRLAFDVLLGREPDDEGLANFSDFLRQGGTRRQMVADNIASEEFRRWKAFGPSFHAGRSAFVRSLPKARRIVDLGGTLLAYESGAMVAMGYPYRFDELTIVDLPPEDRHPLYQDSVPPDRVVTPQGLVTYRNHSMTDLGGIEDGSVDLVYSGPSIEHVSVDDATSVVEEVHRVLRPGGWFALDTPNSVVTRRQQPGFIDPDHEFEYGIGELLELVSPLSRRQGDVWTQLLRSVRRQWPIRPGRSCGERRHVRVGRRVPHPVRSDG